MMVVMFVGILAFSNAIVQAQSQTQENSPTAFLEAAISGKSVKPAPAQAGAGIQLPQISALESQMAQAASAKKAQIMAAFSPKFSGFIRFDTYFDTRQVIGFRLDANQLFPFPQQLDSTGKDIAAAPQFHMAAFKTNMKWTMDGPTTLGARPRAVIAADYSGPWSIDNVTEARPGLSISAINGLMLQEAYFKLDWCNGSLLFGQYWHPLYDPRVSSGSLMLEPIARSPQVRAALFYRCWEASVTASGQIDFPNDGPNFFSEVYEPKFTQFLRRTNPSLIVPDRSPAYLNHSVIPNMTFKFQGVYDKNIFGVALDVKILKPRLFTAARNNAGLEFLVGADGRPLIDVAYFQATPPANFGQPVPELVPDPLSVVKTFKADKHVAGFSAMGFMGLQSDCWTVKLKGVYGEMLSDQYMIGGYGVVGRNTATGAEEYAPVRSGSVLAEMSYANKKFQATVFGGYSKNLGLRGCKELVKNLANFNENFPNNVYDVYHFIPNMDYIWRVNGTLKWLRMPVVFAGSLEYSSAAFGDLTPQAKVINAKKVHNVRVLFSSYYFFQ